MLRCFFVSDLHGRVDRYEKLLDAVRRERPGAVFAGGDLLAHAPSRAPADAGGDFVADYLAPEFLKLRVALGCAAPRVFLILGNDDPRSWESAFVAGAAAGAWEYVHNGRAELERFDVWGYACVPPTPFRLKDWERYDVSRYVDPGSVSPEEGWRSVPVTESEVRYGTIADDLARLAGGHDQARAIWLLHSPPYRTDLDRAGLDGRLIDHVPLDVHVGSVAIRRFIETRQPLLTLHGHIHESARLTGAWSQRIGRTWCLSAAHDGPELALVRFDPDDLAGATRSLV
jgi:Icc-related predicted phosphoesterase